MATELLVEQQARVNAPARTARHPNITPQRAGHPDDSMPAGLLTPDEFAEMRRHLEAAFPEEGCGLLVAPGPGHARTLLAGAREFRRCRNVQHAWHVRDPFVYPPATEGYRLGDEDLAALNALLESGGRLLAIVHSHTRGIGDHLSRADVTAARCEIQSQSPATLQIVGAVREGRLEAMSAFRWDTARGAFLRVGCLVMKDGAMVQPVLLPLVMDERAASAGTLRARE